MSLSEGQGCFTTLGLPLGFGILTSVANFHRKKDTISLLNTKLMLNTNIA